MSANLLSLLGSEAIGVARGMRTAKALNVFSTQSRFSLDTRGYNKGTVMHTFLYIISHALWLD